MTASPCLLDVVQESSQVVAEVVRVDRPRPQRSVELTVYADGAAACDRCQQRHPADQLLARRGVQRPRGAPVEWGRTAAERAADEQPAGGASPWPKEF